MRTGQTFNIYSIKSIRTHRQTCLIVQVLTTGARCAFSGCIHAIRACCRRTSLTSRCSIDDSKKMLIWTRSHAWAVEWKQNGFWSVRDLQTWNAFSLCGRALLARCLTVSSGSKFWVWLDKERTEKQFDVKSGTCLKEWRCGSEPNIESWGKVTDPSDVKSLRWCLGTGWRAKRRNTRARLRHQIGRNLHNNVQLRGIACFIEPEGTGQSHSHLWITQQHNIIIVVYRCGYFSWLITHKVRPLLLIKKCGVIGGRLDVESPCGCVPDVREVLDSELDALARVNGWDEVEHEHECFRVDFCAGDCHVGGEGGTFEGVAQSNISWELDEDTVPRKPPDLEVYFKRVHVSIVDNRRIRSHLEKRNDCSFFHRHCNSGVEKLLAINSIEHFYREGTCWFEWGRIEYIVDDNGNCWGVADDWPYAQVAKLHVSTVR